LNPLTIERQLTALEELHFRSPSTPMWATSSTTRYLGHRSITSTVRYTALAPDRFKGFWKD
jgi:hypothetical protein